MSEIGKDGKNIIKSTVDYFMLDETVLNKVANEHGYTKEDNLIFDSGVEVTHFASIEDWLKEEADFMKYVKCYNYSITAVLKRLDGRIAVVLD